MVESLQTDTCDSSLWPALVALRKSLHAKPERAGQERETARMLKAFLRETEPDLVLEQLGGTGLAFVYQGQEPGEVLVLRADMDAVPVQEDLLLDYCSLHPGVSHKCGHDGHMAMVAGVGLVVGQRKVKQGTLILLFQPAEETGEGARRIVADASFCALKPDYVFALHNYPGLPEHSLGIKEQGMTIASTGMHIHFLGQEAHAMAPEQGRSPIEAVKTIHTALQHLHCPDRNSERFSLITTVGMRVGGEDYGVAPANGELFLTVRAYENDLLAALLDQIATLCQQVAREQQLTLHIAYKESFPASINDPACTAMVRRAAEHCGLACSTLQQPFGASEDIAHLLAHAHKGGAFVLLGAGLDQANLHSPDYDFNDGIIADGVRLFTALIADILGFAEHCR